MPAGRRTVAAVAALGAAPLAAARPAADTGRQTGACPAAQVGQAPEVLTLSAGRAGGAGGVRRVEGVGHLVEGDPVGQPDRRRARRGRAGTGPAAPRCGRPARSGTACVYGVTTSSYLVAMTV